MTNGTGITGPLRAPTDYRVAQSRRNTTSRQSTASFRRHTAPTRPWRRPSKPTKVSPSHTQPRRCSRATP